MKPILIIRLGEPVPEVQARRGDFEDWIGSGMQRPASDFQVVDVPSGGLLPAPMELAGVVLTGSAAMVSERAAWSEQTANWLAEAVQADLPVLGICYGHQLIAHALGGRVGPNPNGREIGTARVRLQADGDALLGALPEEISVQTSHCESVLELPSEAALLGETDLDPHHAFRIGDRVWGVQFHPEFDADIMRGYIEARRPQLEEEGLPADELVEACADSPHGARVLERFSERVRSDSAG